MNKELQNLAWSVLPKEFKEETKIEYLRHNAISPFSGACDILCKLFGHHNLTSDAEGEEMLTVSRKQVQEIYSDNCVEIHRECVSSSDKDCYETVNEVLKTLFGSKCLPDKLNEDNFAKSEQKPKSVSEISEEISDRVAKTIKAEFDKIEPKPAEPKYHKGEKVRYNGYVYEVEGLVGKNRYALKGLNFDLDEGMIAPYIEPEENVNLSQETATCDKQFDNILKGSFSKERRLNIAVQILSGIVASDKPYRHPVKRAIELTDALLAELDKTKKNEY